MKKIEHTAITFIWIIGPLVCSVWQLMVAPPVFAGQQTYTLQNLGNFTPLSINENSQITGYGLLNTEQYVGLWQNGKLSQLSPPGLSGVMGEDISNSGEIVGVGYDANGVPQGFAWTLQQGFITNEVPNGDSSDFTGVNDSGQISGRITTPQNGWTDVPALWNSQGAIQLLPSLSNGNNLAYAINASGAAVGISGTIQSNAWPLNPNAPYGENHAVLWQNGNVIDLTPNDPWSIAMRINNNSQVIGSLIDPSTQETLFFEWDPASGLSILPGNDIGDVLAINDSDQVVGLAFDNGASESYAAIWEDGAEFNLNDFLSPDSGWMLEEATDINDEGDIIGIGTYNGQAEGFLLTPDGITSIPEPAAISLAAGFCLLAFRRRRKGSSEDGQ